MTPKEKFDIWKSSINILIFMEFMKISRSILICLFFFLCSFISNEIEESQYDKALYAVSSLRCHIQQLKNEKDKDLEIDFEAEDIEQLWDAAQHPDHQGLIHLAKHHYDHFEIDEAQDYLDHIWGHFLTYPNFDKNAFITKSMRSKIGPYLLPAKHPFKPIIDSVFATSRVTSNLDTLVAAGFQILHVQESSFIIVAKHPLLPQYLFKLYTDSEVRTRLNKPSWRWLLDRCIGAERIRKLIDKKKIKNFTVAEKWLYPLPPIPANGVQHPLVLLVTDLNLVSQNETMEAWRSKVTTQHLDELYIILSHGFGSNFLSGNVPYTKSGKFAFIDTEYPYREITLSKVKKYIAPELHAYWDQLVTKGGRKS